MDAPKHLKASTRRWFRDVLAEFDLEQHHVRLLILAGEAWDRGAQARAEIDRHGLTFLDGNGLPRTRPEIAVERDCRLAFARLLRELDLDVVPPAEPARPPSLRSNRRGIDAR